MIFAPHILQKKVVPLVQNDEYGQPIIVDEESWEDVCMCRCDDSVTEWKTSDNGAAYITKHHIVCDGRLSLREGEYVRCVENNVTRAEGEVYMVKMCNFFGYTELYI